MPKPILCLDFDGVIHSYTSGWRGADVIPDPPVDGAFDFIAEAQQHFRVMIFSSRSGQPGGILAMQRWLTTHGLPEPVWLALEFPTEKPPATVTIDDRAIQFTGKWPDMDDLIGFEPWNKRNEPDHQIDDSANAEWDAAIEFLLSHEEHGPTHDHRPFFLMDSDCDGLAPASKEHLRKSIAQWQHYAALYRQGERFPVWRRGTGQEDANRRRRDAAKQIGAEQSR